jgi:lysozyme
MDMERLQQTLIKHEALKLMPYRCSSDCLTIGVGRNLDDKGISERVAMIMLNEDIEDAISDLTRNLPYFGDLPECVKEALVNMVFNMGISRFLQFKKTLAYIKEGKYKKAGNECLDSRWATQVGYRALEVAALIKLGDDQ